MYRLLRDYVSFMAGRAMNNNAEKKSFTQAHFATGVVVVFALVSHFYRRE